MAMGQEVEEPWQSCVMRPLPYIPRIPWDDPIAETWHLPYILQFMGKYDKLQQIVKTKTPEEAERLIASWDEVRVEPTLEMGDKEEKREQEEEAEMEMMLHQTIPS